MKWRDDSKRLSEVLGLSGSPVAVTFSMDAPREPASGRHWVCQVMLDARDGKTISLTKENSACPGGSAYLGLRPMPEGAAAKPLKNFLVNGEKLFSSVATFHRALANNVKPPLGLAETVVFAPLDKAELMPDLVLFIVNPEQACRLIQLAVYWDGISPKVQLTGSGCHQAVTYPLVSGEINVSFMDWTARRGKPYKPDELIVSVPYHRLHGIVEAIDRCSAGTAPLEYPEDFRRSADADTGVDRPD